MDFQVDRESRVPVYLQLEEQIRFQIATGALKHADRLPSIRELAHRLGINLNTVSRAYKGLEQQELIEIRGPKGTFVSARVEGTHRRSANHHPLVQIADVAIREAHRLGYELDELLHTLTDRIEHLQDASHAPRVAFVECNRIEATESAEHLTSQLGIATLPLVLSELEETTVPNTVKLVITTFFHLGRVKALIGGKSEVVGVVVTSPIEVLQRISSLPAGTQIAVVCRDEETLPAMVNMVGGICADSGQVKAVLMSNDATMREQLAEAGAVVYTPPCRDCVTQAASPGQQRIELVPEIDAQSMEMLRGKIEELRRRIG